MKDQDQYDYGLLNALGISAHPGQGDTIRSQQTREEAILSLKAPEPGKLPDTKLSGANSSPLKSPENAEVKLP